MEQLADIKRAFFTASGINDVVNVAKCADAFGALGTPEGNAWQALASAGAGVFTGDFARARETLLASLDEITALHDDGALIRYYTTLGIASNQMGLPDAIEMFSRSFEICERIGNRSGMAAATSNIGIVHFHATNNPEALEYFSRALDLYTELQERNGMANTMCNVGNTFASAGDFATALRYHLQSLEIHEITGNLNNKALVCGNIGRNYSEMRDRENAVPYITRSIELYTQLGNKSGIATATGMLASAYSRAADHEASIPLHRAAIEIFRALDQRPMLVMTSTNLASDLVEIGAYEEANAILAELHQAGDSNADHRMIQGRARAKVLFSNNDMEGAKAALTSSLELAVSNNFKSQLPGIYLQFRELSKATGDFEGYVFYNELHQKAEDEVRGAEQLRRFAMQTTEQRLTHERSERQREREILHSTLPQAIAERVIRGEVVNDYYDNASVIFLDIVGFTSLSSQLDSRLVIQILDDVFTKCDAICAKHDVTKIKTIGDSYMAVAFPSDGDSAERAAYAAIEMMHITFNEELEKALNKALGEALIKFRIGIHCGPVTAGVIGTQRMQYDVWGDTVNVASRMESTSEPGRIHISEALNEALTKALTKAHIVPRGEMDIKGKGMMQTYWLVAR